MKKNTLQKMQIHNIYWSFLVFMVCILTMPAQETISIFDEVLYYDGYAPLVDENDLYEPIPADVLRHSNSNYAKKLTPEMLNAIGNTLEIEVNLKAACDNFDRIANVFFAFVPPGASTYNTNDTSIPKVEVARFITPFMNKNISPDNLFYNFKTNNVAEILTNQELLDQYDIWVELQIFGVPYAAQEQVAGCADRIDTFYGTLNFISDTDTSISYEDEMVFIPLAANLPMNDYNATDVPDETTRILTFDLDNPVEHAKLFLITSNHGANTGGEEYNRREHFVYLNEELVYNYIPGGTSCEPFRQFNTQGNGIYGPQARTTRLWLSFNNWCPGDAIPIREIELGTLAAGQHTFKIDVPSAVFTGDQGNIPLSVYLHNRTSGNEVCVPPSEIAAEGYSDSEVFIEWVEDGTAENWEILYGPLNNINIETVIAGGTPTATEALVGDLTPSMWYQLYVRAVCDTDFESTWAGPVNGRTEQLSLLDNQKVNFIYFPNPVENTLYVKTDELPFSSIKLFDVEGKLLTEHYPNSSSVSLDVKQLSKGMYFMKVEIQGSHKTVRVIKK